MHWRARLDTPLFVWIESVGLAIKWRSRTRDLRHASRDQWHYCDTVGVAPPPTARRRSPRQPGKDAREAAARSAPRSPPAPPPRRHGGPLAPSAPDRAASSPDGSAWQRPARERPPRCRHGAPESGRRRRAPSWSVPAVPAAPSLVADHRAGADPRAPKLPAANPRRPRTPAAVRGTGARCGGRGRPAPAARRRAVPPRTAQGAGVAEPGGDRPGGRHP